MPHRDAALSFPPAPGTLHRRRGLAATTLLVAALAVTNAARAATVGYAAIPTTSDYATAEKPQSKLFHHDGSWWAVVQGPDGVAFYELVADTWQRGAFLDALLAPTGKADVRWDGTGLFVLNYASTAQLFKYAYDTELRIWLLRPGFPVTLPKPSGTETMVLEQDSTGRLWMTTEGNGSICAYYTTSADHRTWSSSPVVLRTGVNTDDISSVIAFGGDRIGVFWSDQVRDEFGFRVHLDADAPESWGDVEVADAGLGVADDHLHLAADARGRVFAVTKDDFDRIQVHRRDAEGRWTTARDVIAGIGTRGIVLLSEAEARLYVVYTRWGSTPNPIEYRTADPDSLRFGPSTTLLASPTTSLNDATSTKQPLPAGSLVVMGNGGDRIWWNGWTPRLDPRVRPAAPTGLVASLRALPARVELAWGEPSTGAPDGYNVYVQIDGGAPEKLNADLVRERGFTHADPPLGALCYQVTAVASELQSPVSSSACVQNQPVEPPAAPAQVVARPIVPGSVTGELVLWFDAGQGQLAADLSGRGNHGNLGSSTGPDANDPVWVQGTSGTALQFDGRDDYVHVSDAGVFDFPGSFTVEAWARRAPGTKGCLVNKGTPGTRTIRVSVTSQGNVEFVWDERSGAARSLTASAAIADAAWHHVACVYDQEASRNRIFVDGVLRASGSAAGTPAVNAKPLYVGVRPASTMRDPWNGAVDQLRVARGVLYAADFTPLAGATLAADADPASGRSVLLEWTPPGSGGAAAAYDVHRSVDGTARTRLGQAVTGTAFIDENVPVGSLCYEIEALNVHGEPGPPGTVCLAASTPPHAPSAPEALSVTWADTTVAGRAAGNAAYDFDEGTGQIAADGTGNVPAAQLGSGSTSDSSDPAWVAGLAGSALRFDGSNDRVRVGDAAALRLEGGFTLEAWVRRGSTGTTDCILGKGDTGRRNYSLMFAANGRIELQWETTAGVVHTTTTADSVADNAWHHVAAVHDQAAGENRIYLDGVLRSRAAASGAPITSDDPAYAGTRRVGGSFKSYFHGTIDLVRIAGWAVYTSNFTPPTTHVTSESRRVARLAWQAPAEGSASGYLVERATGDDDFARLTPSPIASTSWVDASPPSDEACYRVRAVDAAGTEGPASAPACLEEPPVKPQSSPEAPALPARVVLQAGPNPFNPSTVLRFDLPQAAHVRIDIHDVRGRRITSLVDAALPAGRHAVPWSGTAGGGTQLASGVYFARLQAGEANVVLKLLMLK